MMKAFFVLLLAPVFAVAMPKFSKDVPAAIKNQMIQDIEMIQTLNGGAPSRLYSQIFGQGPLDGQILSEFFNSRIDQVDLDDCGMGNAVACVQGGTTMYLTKNFLKADISQILRVSILFHEARHTEKDNFGWPHVNCPKPYLDDQGRDVISSVTGLKVEGLPGCDDEALGAYGLEAIFLKNIANTCANCSEKMIMDAEIFGEDTLLRISNQGVRKLMKDDLQKK